MRRLTAPIGAAAGVPAITQGSYGAVGNLELVVPDPADGAWVYWRNSDPADVRPGAVAGGWSAGLRILAGRRGTAVAVLETVHGSRTLEVVAVADGGLVRTVWQPDRGFGEQQSIAPSASGVPLIEQDRVAPHALRVTFLGPSGLSTLEASIGHYPTLGWGTGSCPAHVGQLADPLVSVIDRAAPRHRPTIVRAPGDGSVRVVRGRTALVSIDVDGRPVDAVAACLVRLPEPGLVIVMRSGSELLEVDLVRRGAGYAAGAPRLVRTDAWVEDGA